MKRNETKPIKVTRVYTLQKLLSHYHTHEYVQKHHIYSSKEEAEFARSLISTSLVEYTLKDLIPTSTITTTGCLFIDLRHPAHIVMKKQFHHPTGSVNESYKSYRWNILYEDKLIEDVEKMSLDERWKILHAAASWHELGKFATLTGAYRSIEAYFKVFQVEDV